jgi:F420-0:gamma-glutamyl ligase
MGQTTEKAPVVLVRGYQPQAPSAPELAGVKPLLRPKAMDMFR